MNNMDHATNSDNEPELPKLPFKRLVFALNRVVDVAIPLHIQLLKQHSENIQNLKIENSHLELRSEQVKAAKTVQLLKTDIFELEKLNIQVREEDTDLFQQKIQIPTRNAIEVLSDFMELHSDVLEPFPDSEYDSPSTAVEFPALKCNLSQQSSDVINEEHPLPAIKFEVKEIVLEKPASDSWSFLRKELLEVHALIRHFASLVFKQQESIDSIQNNIQDTHENVYIGTKYLKKASLLKAATFPITGAVVGGLLLGPIGALAGFKLLGSIACVAGGGAIGYSAGVKLKRKQQVSCDIEMKALTYPSRTHSLSNPELSKISETSDKS